MAIEHADVLRAAHLARISLDDADADRYVGDLSRILNMVDRLQEVNTDDVMPLSHPLDATQPLRPDEVTETNERERFQRVAPEVSEGLYLVPRVVE